MMKNYTLRYVKDTANLDKAALVELEKAAALNNIANELARMNDIEARRIMSQWTDIDNQSGAADDFYLSSGEQERKRV
jgi:hypothetical protein